MVNDINTVYEPTDSIPLVSIITATYNSEKFIQETYASIASQTIGDWEWIITDDCSTDSTVHIIKSICMNDNRVKFIVNQKNSGAAVSRNTSLSRCKGKFIAFIDSDDLWLPNKLEKQIEFMSEGYDFTFTGYELINENGDSLNKRIDINPHSSI
ncbi:glycosyltransferase family 2 protein, partial [Yersinia kristensenii]|uniref:glycosyltransferase family 2 protein n=1 Tax=Yersinia kristensenii TaxID=28152 RepID=UPI0011A41BF7